MKQSIVLVISLMIAPPIVAQSATDKAEKRLSDLLAPGSSTTPLTTTQQIRWKAGKSVEAIDVPIKPYAGLPARLPQTPIKEVKPRSAPEGIPLVSYRDASPVPQQVELPTKPLIRLPSLDLHTPLAIPILAQATKDRASLGEPAFEASLDAAMKRFSPVRDKPVPFMPLNLPDPFEHLRYGQLRNPPNEEAMPPVIPSTRPKQ